MRPLLVLVLTVMASSGPAACGGGDLTPNCAQPAGSEGSTQYFPDWQDQTLQIARALGREGDGQQLVDDVSGAYAEAASEKRSPDEGSQAQISAENVNLLDADVVVFATEQAEDFDALQRFGTVDDLAAVRQNRAVYTDEILAGAIYFITPLSLEYVLDELTPLLEQATAGEAPRAFPGR